MRVEQLTTLTAVGSTTAVLLDFRRDEAVRFGVYFDGAVGTSLSYRVEVSADGTNWHVEGGAQTTLPNKITSTTPAKHVRVTATAGTGFTLNSKLCW